MRSDFWKHLKEIRIDEHFYTLAFVYPFPLRLCLMMQHIQYEMLRAAHWTRCFHGYWFVACIRLWLSSALPFLKDSIIWAQAFLLLRQYVKRGRVKVMSGGCRLALIINHLVPLSSTFCILLVPWTWLLLLLLLRSIQRSWRVHVVGDLQNKIKLLSQRHFLQQI